MSDAPSTPIDALDAAPRVFLRFGRGRSLLAILRGDGPGGGFEVLVPGLEEAEFRQASPPRAAWRGRGVIEIFAGPEAARAEAFLRRLAQLRGWGDPVV